MEAAHLLDHLVEIALPRRVDGALDDRDQLRFIGLDAGRQPQRSARAAGDLECAFRRERKAAERTDELRKRVQVIRCAGPAPAVRRIAAECERERRDDVRFAMRMDADGPPIGFDRMQDTSPELRIVAADARATMVTLGGVRKRSGWPAVRIP